MLLRCQSGLNLLWPLVVRIFEAVVAVGMVLVVVVLLGAVGVAVMVLVLVLVLLVVRLVVRLVSDIDEAFPTREFRPEVLLAHH